MPLTGNDTNAKYDEDMLIRAAFYKRHPNDPDAQNDFESAIRNAYLERQNKKNVRFEEVSK